MFRGFREVQEVNRDIERINRSNIDIEYMERTSREALHASTPRISKKYIDKIIIQLELEWYLKGDHNIEDGVRYAKEVYNLSEEEARHIVMDAMKHVRK